MIDNIIDVSNLCIEKETCETAQINRVLEKGCVIQVLI